MEGLLTNINILSSTAPVVITNGEGCALTGTADIDHVLSFRELRLAVD